MISNKTLATLSFIIFVVVPVVFTSRIPKTGLLDKFFSHVKRLIPKSKTKKYGPVLQDTTNNGMDVQPVGNVVMSIPQELSVPQVNSQFKKLIEKGEYKKIFELGKKMSDEEFLEQLCPVIETLDQCKGVVKYLKGPNWVASFYVYGNIEVVKGVIVEFGIYDDDKDHFKNGALEKAPAIALEKDRHDRVIELLDFRKGITAEEDGRCKLKGVRTSFERFVSWFLYDLVPREDGMALKRFLTLRGEELRTTYPDILDTLCQELLGRLGSKLYSRKTERCLVDLIGQPSLLTTTAFVGGFLGTDENLSKFIKYGWREIIQECLKTEYEHGRWKLWRVMQAERPDQFRGKFPSTEEARIAACAHLPTKRELEIQWIKRNAPGFLETVEPVLLDIFPIVLIPIVIEYANPTWIDVPSTKP